MKLSNTLCLCLFFAFKLTGQSIYNINLLNKEDNDIFQKEGFSFNFDSQLKYFDFINECKEEGYLECRLDSIIKNRDTATIFMFLGPKYKWEMLSLDKAEDMCSKRFNKQVKDIEQSKFSFGEFIDYKDELLNCYDNSGRPFAKLELSSEFNSGTIRSKTLLDPGPLIYIDSILNHGDLDIKDYILYFILDVKKGSLYNADKLYALRERLKKQRFIKSDSSHIIKFYKDKASLNLYLNNEKINYVNGVLGVFPDADFDNKLKLNGEMSISLNNVIEFGERLDMKWRAMDKRGQEFKLSVDFPVIINNGLGAGADIEMFKLDTLFFNMDNRLTIALARSRSIYAVNITHSFSNILNIDTNQAITKISLPENLDFVSYLYGLSFKHDKIKEGYYFKDPVGCYASLNAGVKTIIENDLFVNVKTDDIGEVLKKEYDSLNSNTSNIRLAFGVFGRILFSDRLALKLGFKTNSMFSKVYLDNEVFRLGGIKDIRGFNEGEIQAHRFALLNSEVHFGLEQSSSVFCFYDKAYFRNFTSDQKTLMSGFGLGLSIRMATGQLKLIYAYGKQKEMPILWSNAKLHFGYISYF